METLDEATREYFLNSAYEKLLREADESVHRAIRDVLDCKMDDVKRTKVIELREVLNNFSGETLNRKKEELMEFLRIMPEYKTANPNLLTARLQALKEELKKRGKIEDLLIWAKLKYKRKEQSNMQEQVNTQEPVNDEDFLV